MTGSTPPRWLVVTVAITTVTLTMPTLGASATSTDDQPLPDIQPGLEEKLATAGPQETIQAIVQMDEAVTETTVEQAMEMGLDTMPPLNAVPSVYLVRGTADEINAYIDQEPVAYATWNHPLEFDLETSTVAAGAANVTGNLEGTGGPLTVNGEVIDGGGTTIAVIDSGIDATHPDLPFLDKVTENFKFACTTPGLVQATNQYCFGNWLVRNPTLNSNPCTSTTDPLWIPGVPQTDTSSGHGTHVASTAAGSGAASNGLFQGVAPAANVIGFSVGEAGVLWGALSAVDWLACNGDTIQPPLVAVNNSYGQLGCNNGGPSPFVGTLLGMLVDKGITPVYSAGNDGGDGSQQCTSVTASTTVPGVMMVANYDDRLQGTIHGDVSDTSSRGDQTDPVTWPDLSAPGELITAARATTVGPSTAVGTLLTDLRDPVNYMQLSGTSMAAPHVTGAVALLNDLDPSITPSEAQSVLNETAHEFGNAADYGPAGSFDKGHGLLDVSAAVHAHANAEGITVSDDGDGGTGEVDLDGELFYLRTGPTGVGNVDAEYFGWQNQTAPSPGLSSLWHEITPLTNSNEYTIPAMRMHGDLVLDEVDVNLTFWARSDALTNTPNPEMWEVTFAMGDHVETKTLPDPLISPGIQRYDVTFEDVTANDTSFRVELDSAFINTNNNNLLFYDSTDHPTSLGFGVPSGVVASSSSSGGSPGDAVSRSVDASGPADVELGPFDPEDGNVDVLDDRRTWLAELGLVGIGYDTPGAVGN